MEKLLYLLGEAIAMCLDCVEEVSYPRGIKIPSYLLIKTEDGREFILNIKEKTQFIDTQEAI